MASIASTSTSLFRRPVYKQLNTRLFSSTVEETPRKFIPTKKIVTFPLQPVQRFTGTAHYATSAYTQAKSNATSLGNVEAQKNANSSSESKGEEESEADPDEPPKKATIRERLRFLTRRYGWWALGVYLLASLVDFSLVFVSIHLLGTEHIRELEDKFRNYIGMGRRELEDHEVAVWPIPLGSGMTESPEGISRENNAESAKVAAKRVQRQEDVAPNQGNKATSSSSSSSGSGTLWTEALLAYTIHKTLLLPFRVGVTAAITPSFVKYMVKLGWAKNNAAVQQAAHKVKMARDAAKAKANLAPKRS